ncbi:MAG: hypothetical protein DCC65_03905 [Planctomycetota bacterium]|nr:MAG: hypothetical protein DCC65_03905 [Planctomycetota bacterium]
MDHAESDTRGRRSASTAFRAARFARTDRDRRIRLLLAVCVALSLAHPSRARQPAAEPDPGSKQLSLEERQAIIKDRVARLEDRMFQLAQAIRKSEPEKSGQLMQSLGAARGMMIRAKMEEIAKKLDESQFADAVDSQKAVHADLQALLKMLMEGPDQLDDRRKEIEKLEELRKQLDGVIKEQREAQRNARAAEGKPSDTLAAAVGKLQRLLDRQRALSAKPGEDLPKAADEQAEIQSETETLADELRDAQAEGNPADADGKMGEAADGLERAAGAMESAGQELRKNNPDMARPPQTDAEQAMEEALQKLKDKMDRDTAERKANAPLQKQAAEQKNITDKTRKLGKKMKEQSGEPSGDSQEGSQGKEGQEGKEGQQGQQGKQGQQKPGAQQEGSQSPEDSGEQAPGAQNIQEAVPFQEQAEQELDEKDPGKAAEAQAKALEKLEEAQRELEKKLEQLRKEQQEELLAALESRFKAMLARQLEVNKGTDRLDELGAANWRRADQLELADIAQKQTWVGEEAEKALYILKEEGTTVVFPQVVEHVRDDAAEAARLLTAANTGGTTRGIQAAIVDTLRELIEAIEKKQAENEAGEGNQNSGEQDQNKNQPLLPPSAELKLLRSCQLRVNEATQRLDSDVGSAGQETDEVRERRIKLARRQQQVHDMARSMHEAIRQAQ